MRKALYGAAITLVAVAAQADGGDEDEGFTGRLAAADAARGEKVFVQCRGCHMAAADGAHMAGPNLYGVIGREAGTAAGFGFYSAAMKAAGISWSPERLDSYLANPRAVLAGTSMAYGGLKDAGARADLIAYLQSLK
ncbi:MAG: c-type cytochrome [Gammaproteobacteria bacterium]|nr:c-type cytochrome [Gammaproteobacteria bacterium]